jgi:hypothetical protein
LLPSGWSHCSLELLHLSDFPLLNLGGSISLPPALHILSAPTSEEARTRNPKGCLSAASHLPTFTGREPVWRFWPAASAVP